MTSQFQRFFIVGTIGFVVDVAVLFLAVSVLGTGPYLGRAISFLSAATATWALNRRFTFPDADQEKPTRQWGIFVAFMVLGALINNGVYALVINGNRDDFLWLVIGVAAGSIAGLAVNYTTSRLFVFRPPSSG